jgi:hypothetical protein
MGYAAASRAAAMRRGCCSTPAAIFWILGYDTIYAHQDREDDALSSACGATARLFAEKTGPFLAVCYTLTLALLALAGWIGGLSAWFFAAMPCRPGCVAAAITLDVPDLGLRLALDQRDRSGSGWRSASPCCSAACDRSGSVCPRQHGAVARRPGAGNSAAAGQRNHADLARDRGVAGGKRRDRAAVLGLRMARQHRHDAVSAGSPRYRPGQARA